jgi:hypothetical protein
MSARRVRLRLDGTERHRHTLAVECGDWTNTDTQTHGTSQSTLPAGSRIATTPPPEDAPPVPARFTDSSALLAAADRALCASPRASAAPPELAAAVGECVDGGALVKEGGARRWHRATSALCATSTPTSAERSQARAIGTKSLRVSFQQGVVAGSERRWGVLDGRRARAGGRAEQRPPGTSPPPVCMRTHALVPRILEPLRAVQGEWVDKGDWAAAAGRTPMSQRKEPATVHARVPGQRWWLFGVAVCAVEHRLVTESLGHLHSDNAKDTAAICRGRGWRSSRPRSAHRGI